MKRSEAIDSEPLKYRYSIQLNVARIRGHTPRISQSHKHVLYDRIYNDLHQYGSRSSNLAKDLTQSEDNVPNVYNSDLTQSEDNLPKVYNSEATPPSGDVRENTERNQRMENSRVHFTSYKRRQHQHQRNSLHLWMEDKLMTGNASPSLRRKELTGIQIYRFL
ncbi:hypothetical protein DPMN_122371 [Dreissena polymorpha]|uniref:Uncharacterized protein n=1 Tax=Dreissena polymorpha TaxID=45954 RepID=A0A9D4JQC0_DREPO|nr:hypothetical protein DPMN_122371 [Dreissena polymorpha]